jgi:serine/threonine protein kinase
MMRNVLFTLLCCMGPDALGISTPVKVGDTTVVKVRSLGQGSSCEAFAARDASRLDGPDMVLKVFNRAEIAAQEASVLRQWQSTVFARNVPQVVGLDECYLLVTPKAKFFDVRKQRPIFLDDVVKLCNILTFAHETLRLVHRDIKEDNFFVHPDPSQLVLLNDWSSSATLGVSVSHAGSPLSYRHPGRRHETRYRPYPGQDFYALVVSVCRVWTGQRELFGSWRTIADLAHECCLDEMINALGLFLPSRDVQPTGRVLPTALQAAGAPTTLEGD